MNSTTSDVPSFLNPAQAACLKVYMEGDCEHFLLSKNESEFSAVIESRSDTLLKFLIAELSSGEDCISPEIATNRISTLITDLGEIREAISDLPETKWELITDHTKSSDSSDERTEIMTDDQDLDAGKMTKQPNRISIPRFTLLHAGTNNNGYVAEAARTGDIGIYEEVRISVLLPGNDNTCVADVLVGLTENGELRALVTANGEGDGDHRMAIYPLRPIDKAVELFDHSGY